MDYKEVFLNMLQTKRKINCHSKVINILYISPLSPPYGGLASWTEIILKKGLPYPFKVHIVNTGQINRTLFDPLRLNFSEVKRNISILWKLLKVIKKQKIDLIHLNSSLAQFGIFRDWLCTFISRIYKIPYVIHLHIDVEVRSKKAITFNGKPFLYQNIFRRASAIIVLNNQSKETVLSLGDFVDKTFYLPNFVDIDSIPTKKMYISEGKYSNAVFVGALTESKGVYQLLKVLRKTLNLKITFIGEPTKGVQVKVQRLIRKYNISERVFLKGVLPNRETLDIMSLSDFFIFPTHEEGFPISVAEAMAIGLPVLASPAGAIPDMIEDGKGGYIIDPENIEGYVKAINIFERNRELLFQMGKYNQEKAKTNYDYPIVVERICKLYKTVLGFDLIISEKT